MGIPVITEKKYLDIAPRLFTANGTITGVVTIATTRHFKVKQRVILQTAIIPPSDFAVKRVISATQMVIGPINAPIEAFSDISSYTVAGGAMVYLPEQKRTTIPWEEQERATYEEEPTVARRVFMVDELGDGYRKDNPLPVQLSDGSINIGTINAELEVFLTHLDNYPNLGEIHDSVRIGNGINEVTVNNDGSINVNVAPVTTPFVQNFNVILANTEYSVTLPANTKRFIIKSRSGNPKIQLSYLPGTTSTAYITIRPGVVYAESSVLLTVPTNLYFRSSKPSEVIEVVSWN